MSDVENYIKKRKAQNPEYFKNFEAGYEKFKIGYLLQEARKEAGITQTAVAEKIGTKKSAISRIENHAEDIRFSTLQKYAHAIGKKIQLNIV